MAAGRVRIASDLLLELLRLFSRLQIAIIYSIDLLAEGIELFLLVMDKSDLFDFVMRAIPKFVKTFKLSQRVLLGTALAIFL